MKDEEHHPSEAEMTMAIYLELYHDEADKLKSIDKEVSEVLISIGETKRPVWNSIATANGRIVRLQVSGKNKAVTLFELSDQELSTASAKEVLSRIHKALQ